MPEDFVDLMALSIDEISRFPEGEKVTRNGITTVREVLQVAEVADERQP
jgi:hypothetical protein